MFCCGQISVSFSHILQGYFTGTGTIHDCPSASEATLKNMGKYITRIHNNQLYNHNKTRHNKMVYIFYGIYSVAWYPIYIPYWLGLCPL